MFADDTSIHTSDKDIFPLANKMQQTLNEVHKWTEKNHMALNPTKTKCMLVTIPQKRCKLTQPMPQLYINSNIIEEVETHTVLGISIPNDLNWTNYIDELSRRVSNKVTQLNKIKHFLNLHTRKIFFYSYIQSIIDYNSTIWDGASNEALKPLFRTHKRAIKQILLKSSNIIKNYEIVLDCA